MTIRRLGRVFAAMALATLALPAAAQSIHQGERTSWYGETRGWTVHSVTDTRGSYLGCRAEKWENGSYLGLEFYENRWQLIAPTQNYGKWGGGVLTIDHRTIDSQFGFQNGYAVKELTSSEHAWVKQGNRLGVWINGDRQLWYSLHGSTAASQKVVECNSRGATHGGYQGQQQHKQHVQPQQHHQFGWQKHNTPLDSRIADCYSLTTPSYRCTVSLFDPDPGYQDAYRIDDAFGQAPSFFFQTINNDQADAWVSFGGGPWQFVGIWGPKAHDPNCSGPVAGQNAEARRNLGQDAWDLCLR